MNQKPHFPLTFVEVAHTWQDHEVIRVIEENVPSFAMKIRIDPATREHSISSITFAVQGGDLTKEKLVAALDQAGIKPVVAVNFSSE